MAVYFVYRTHAGAPSDKYVWRFEHGSLLDWAKAVWKLHDEREDAERYARKVFGDMPGSPLWGLFRRHEEYDGPERLRTMADVKAWFYASIYCEEEAHGAHHIQCLTEWDIQCAVYVFDDHYRAKKPGKADYLLLDGWELPAGDADARTPRLPRTIETKPRGGAEGTLYFIGTDVDCKYNLEDLSDAYHVADLRLPDLAHYLLVHPDPDGLDFPLYRLRNRLAEVLAKPRGEDAGFLKAIRDHPDDRTSWGVYSDWLADRDRPAAGLHLLERALRAEAGTAGGKKRRANTDMVKVTPNMAQVCKRDDDNSDESDDWYDQYIFFDDRWAAAHPTLAAGILTFASRWDVLT
jgi:uncharacterized protein (TIGR02996 family)